MAQPLELFEDQEVKTGDPTLQEDAGREEDDDMSLAAVISEALHQFRAQDREEAIVEESVPEEPEEPEELAPEELALELPPTKRARAKATKAHRPPPKPRPPKVVTFWNTKPLPVSKPIPRSPEPLLSQEGAMLQYMLNHRV